MSSIHLMLLPRLTKLYIFLGETDQTKAAPCSLVMN